MCGSSGRPPRTKAKQQIGKDMAGMRGVLSFKKLGSRVLRPRLPRSKALEERLVGKTLRALCLRSTRPAAAKEAAEEGVEAKNLAGDVGVGAGLAVIRHDGAQYLVPAENTVGQT